MSSSILPKDIVVVEGDTLWTLGENLNVDWQELQSINKLEDDLIFPGQILRVPQMSRVAAAREQSQRPHSERITKKLRDIETKTWVVQPGDTAWDIALRFGLTLEDLEAVNEEVPDLIYPEDIILIPADAALRHKAFTNLKTVKAKIKGVSPKAHFFDVFPPEKDVDEYRKKLRALLDAMRFIESSFIMPAPVGDDGFSIGPLQISNDYHTDAWWLAPEPVNYGRCEEVEHSERTVVNYWLRYCPWALEFDDFETLARIHNGGPQFWRHIKTARYWKKVRSAMRWQFGHYNGIPEMNPELSRESLMVNGMYPLIQTHLPFRIPEIDPIGWDYDDLDYDSLLSIGLK